LGNIAAYSQISLLVSSGQEMRNPGPVKQARETHWVRCRYATRLRLWFQSRVTAALYPKRSFLVFQLTPQPLGRAVFKEQEPRIADSEAPTQTSNFNIEMG